MPHDDVRDLLRHLPNRFNPGDSYLESDIFTTRHRILREMDPQPTSVFEFGALMGYFLVTALDACPSIDRVGWVDNETHTVGSNRACCDNVLHARQDLPGLVFGRSFDDIPMHHTLDAGPPWDVISVDGDHSYAGCKRDLGYALQMDPQVILVDDWHADTHRDDIQHATRDQLAVVGLLSAPRYEITDVIATQNGLAVIRRKP